MSNSNAAINSSATEPVPASAASTQMQTTPVGEGATGALARTPLPAVGQWLSSFAYSCGYYISYGVVFPTLFLVHVIPGARTLTSGFVDGAAAASDYVGGLQAAKAGHSAVALDELGASPASVPA